MQALSPDFWRGRRVFLTGHTGFKGSWLSSWLLELGANVRGFALRPDIEGVPEGEVSFFDELGLPGRMDQVFGDIRNETSLRVAMREFDPEVVLHLAAQPLLRASYKDPVGTYATNVMGTVHLLDICRSLPNLRSVLIVSSDKCYENREQIWGYRETDPMGGNDPYSNSKGCTELVVGAFRSSYFPPSRYQEHGVCLMSARAGNVIGGGDWSVDRLIPDAARAMRKAQSLNIRYPQAVRPWQHVLEPLAGYLMLAEKGAEKGENLAQGWNFGPDAGSTRTVSDVMSALAPQLGDDFSWQAHRQTDEPHEDNLLVLDCTKARQKLGWSPSLSWEDMIAMTAQWYRASEREERYDIVRQQLARYCEM